MSLKSVYISCLSLLIASCATTHPGAKSTNNSQVTDLVMSVDFKPDISDKYYAFLEYTIENKSSEWKELKVTAVGFQGIKNEILVNKRLNSWVEGAELKLKKSQYNTALLLGSIAAVGGIAGATSSNETVQIAGVGAMTVALAGAAAISINDERNRVNSGATGVNQTINVPETHIFNPFTVAPGSFVRRWIVLKRPPNSDYWGIESPVYTEVKLDGKNITFGTSL